MKHLWKQVSSLLLPPLPRKDIHFFIPWGFEVFFCPFEISTELNAFLSLACSSPPFLRGPLLPVSPRPPPSSPIVNQVCHIIFWHIPSFSPSISPITHPLSWPHWALPVVILCPATQQNSTRKKSKKISKNSFAQNCSLIPLLRNRPTAQGGQ